MKKWKITYKDDFLSKRINFIDIIAETSQDAMIHFFNNYSGFIWRVDFIDWV